MSQTSPQHEDFKNRRIAVLCAASASNYIFLQDKYNLDIYHKKRDCRLFKFDCPVITHAPCAQWSRIHKCARSVPEEKDLAWFCLDAVNRCGGIFEHPAGSHFFKTAGIPLHKLTSIEQSWWNFPTKKHTYLYGVNVDWHPLPLNFNAQKKRNFNSLTKLQRSLTTIEFNEWLIKSVLHL